MNLALGRYPKVSQFGADLEVASNGEDSDVA